MGMTGFEENNNEVSQEKAAKTSRRQRRGDDQAQDTKENGKTTVATRIVSASGDEVGRASKLVTHMRDYIKELDITTTIVKEVDRSLAITIADNYTFVIYGNVIASDLYWNVVVFESNVDPVVRREKKKHRERGSRDTDPTVIYNWFTTSDAVNDKIVEALEEWVRNSIRVSGNYYYTEHLIVHATDDVDQPGFWNRIAYNCENANFVRANADAPWGVESLSESSEVRAKLTFEPGRDKDCLGRPIRSDFQIEVAESFQDKNPNIMVANEGSKSLVAVDGYINLRHDGTDHELETYVPEIVLTQVDTNMPNAEGGVLERTLMGIATAPLLLERDAWQANFQDNIDEDELISGLMYGVEASEELVEEAAEFDDNQESRLKLLKSMCHKVVGEKDRRDERTEEIPVEIVLLVREGGPNYAVNKIFMDIADGNKKALSYFCKTVENLLGLDDISEIFDVRKASDVILDEVRVPVGVFHSNKGTRALEYVDTTFMCNRLKNNYTEKLEDYFEANLPEGRDGGFNQVMSRNYAAQQRATSNQSKWLGFATKFYLNPALFEAILDELRDSECMEMEFESNVNVLHTRSRRAGRRSSTSGRALRARGRRRGNDRGTGRSGFRGGRY